VRSTKPEAGLVTAEPKAKPDPRAAKMATLQRLFPFP